MSPCSHLQPFAQSISSSSCSPGAAAGRFSLSQDHLCAGQSNPLLSTEIWIALLPAPGAGVACHSAHVSTRPGRPRSSSYLGFAVIVRPPHMTPDCIRGLSGFPSKKYEYAVPKPISKKRQAPISTKENFSTFQRSNLLRPCPFNERQMVLPAPPNHPIRRIPDQPSALARRLRRRTPRRL